MAKKPADPSFVKVTDLTGEPIPDHDGLPVTASAASLTKTGHGFEESLAIDALHIPMGKRVMLLIPARCTSHEYDFVTEGTGKDKVELEEYRETHVLEAEGVIMLDPDELAAVVENHRAKVADLRAQRAAEAKAKRGELPLPFGTDDEDEDEEGGDE